MGTRTSGQTINSLWCLRFDKKILDQEYKIIVVTNQSGIGRGIYDETTFVGMSICACVLTAMMLTLVIITFVPVCQVCLCANFANQIRV